MSAISETLIRTPVAGLEDLQRAAFYVFFATVNDVLEQVAAYWEDRDTQFDTITGKTLAPTTLESISTANFYEGHKPSLINGTPDMYPNLAVMAMQANPSEETNAFDQLDSWTDQLLVEIMVKASDEETVNRRIQRTVEAALITLRRNPTLGGAVLGMESTPTVVISDVFALKSDATTGGYGERYVWQGGAISWAVRKEAAPPPNGSIFAGSSKTDYSQFIDQG